MPKYEKSEDEADAAVLSVVTTDDLHAYVDGVASQELHEDVESLIGEDARAARWVAAYQHQIACMHRAFGAGDERVPSRLLETLRAGTASAT